MDNGKFSTWVPEYYCNTGKKTGTTKPCICFARYIVSLPILIICCMRQTNPFYQQTLPVPIRCLSAIDINIWRKWYERLHSKSNEEFPVHPCGILFRATMHYYTRLSYQVSSSSGAVRLGVKMICICLNHQKIQRKKKQPVYFDEIDR